MVSVDSTIFNVKNINDKKTILFRGCLDPDWTAHLYRWLYTE